MPSNPNYSNVTTNEFDPEAIFVDAQGQIYPNFASYLKGEVYATDEEIFYADQILARKLALDLLKKITT